MVSLVGQLPHTGMFRSLPGKPNALKASSRNGTTTDARLEQPNYEELVDGADGMSQTWSMYDQGKKTMSHTMTYRRVR